MKEAFRRLGAYLIDLILVYVASSVIAAGFVTVTNGEEFLNTYNEYNEFNSTYEKFFIDFEEYFSDNKLNENEYNKIVEEYPGIALGLEEAYQDKQLSKKEYNQVYDDTYDTYNELFIEQYYKISKSNIVTSVTSIILMFVYFVIIQYFTKGQTVGKRLLKFRVVSKDNHRVTINNLILRSLIITDIVWSSIKIYCLYNMDAYGYYNASLILGRMMYIVLFVSLLFVIYRNDRRSIQDLFAGTKVIETGDE